jgi:hypothetical protein
MKATVKAPPKGKLDRARCAQDYTHLCAFFHVKRVSDAEIAKLTLMQFYAMVDDIFARQPFEAQRRYAEHTRGIGNPKFRRNPLAFKWYLVDFLKNAKARGIKRFGLSLITPVTWIIWRIDLRKSEKALQQRAKLKVVK